MFPRKYKITRMTFQAGVLLLAGAVAAERVYTNDHHSSDVAVGLVIGFLFAWFLVSKRPGGRGRLEGNPCSSLMMSQVRRHGTQTIGAPIRVIASLLVV